MIFLPIVGRELTVASRRTATYWTRVIAAGFWMFIAGCFFIIQYFSQRGGMPSVFDGRVLFLVLSWLAFCYTSTCGIFLTSDTISEEKREGTFGLLFLTDLRGFDIVLGKLSATSLQACYSLLAVFPIFALPFLLGGVTGELFGKMMLILLNSLFFSLAAGIFVSSISDDSQKAINGTLSLLAVLAGLTLLFDWWRAGWKDIRFSPFIGFISPVLSFGEALENRFSFFWCNLAVSHLFAWLLLIAASLSAPRNWQQKETVKTKRLFFSFLRSNPEKQRLRLRNLFMTKQPAFWLSMREQTQSFYFKLVFFVACLVVGLMFWSDNTLPLENVNDFLKGLSPFLSLLLMLWVSVLSSRFFVDAKRTGALELLLCSPLPARDIVQGHWRALRSGFAFPIFLTLGLQITTEVLGWLSMINTANASINGMSYDTYTILQVFDTLISDVLRLAALGWFGMWMGLTTSKASTAVIKTFVFVVVLPVIASGILEIFIQLFSVFAIFPKLKSTPGDWMVIMHFLVSCFLSATISIVFITISRRKLFSRFRELATGDRIPKLRGSDLQENALPIVTT